MKSFYNISLVLLFVVSVSFFSCEIQEYDKPDTESGEVTIQELLKGTLIQTAHNQVAMPERIANVLMQYFEEGDASVIFLENYNLIPDYTRYYWSLALFEGSLKSALALLREAQSQGNKNVEAIAKIILALEFGNTASNYGDIPYTEALRAEEGILTPVFDSQEKVYTSIITLLEEAIQDMTGGIESSIESADPYTNGNMTKWRKLAHGLLARYALHMSIKDPSQYQIAIDHINESFSSISEQVEFSFVTDAAIEHPMYSFGIERPSAFFINEAFIASREATNDPRRFSYYGYNSYNVKFENHFWTSSNSFVPIVSFVELQFIKAECELMIGSSDAVVSNTLNKAISASMDQLFVAGSTYVESQSDLSIFESSEEKLEHIITEAYNSYYGFAALQSWNNYRRLGYPSLTLTGSSNVNNPSGVLPKRFLYPTSLAQFNNENLMIAVENQNGAQLDDPVWLYR